MGPFTDERSERGGDVVCPGNSSPAGLLRFPEGLLQGASLTHMGAHHCPLPSGQGPSRWWVSERRFQEG